MEPPADDVLFPVENLLWDRQQRRYDKKIIRVPVSEPLSTHLGGFQRSAQAAVLIHQAMLWDRGTAGPEDPVAMAHFAYMDEHARRLIEAMITQASRCDEFMEGFSMCIRSDLPSHP